MSFSLGLERLEGLSRSIPVLLLAAAALAASLFLPGRFTPDPAWIAVVLCGVPIAAEAAEGLFTRFDIRADVLVTIALAASVATGEIFAAGEVALIMQLGSLLEDKTAARASSGS